MGPCKHPDPDLQADQRRAARLAHRRAATHRLGSNKEPRIAHAAAVELAPTIHRRRVITTTTAYPPTPLPRQSVQAVMMPRRLRSKSSSAPSLRSGTIVASPDRGLSMESGRLKWPARSVVIPAAANGSGNPPPVGFSVFPTARRETKK